jgi:hypothetical protein
MAGKLKGIAVSSHPSTPAYVCKFGQRSGNAPQGRILRCVSDSSHRLGICRLASPAWHRSPPPSANDRGLAVLNGIAAGVGYIAGGYSQNQPLGHLGGPSTSQNGSVPRSGMDEYEPRCDSERSTAARLGRVAFLLRRGRISAPIFCAKCAKITDRAQGCARVAAGLIGAGSVYVSVHQPKQLARWDC